MKSAVPNYYSKFKCIADKCEHSCCIGWEIAVDETTLSRYRNTGGDIGRRLTDSISKDACFVLDNDSRCPFLNSGGLCDIITELGEDALCDICREHPRFRSYYSSFCEIGLGLCCEHAGEIILGFLEPFALEGLENVSFTGQEDYFFSLRQKAFSIVQNRNESMLKRMEKLSVEYDLDFWDISVSDLAELHLSMERLNDEWTIYLNSLTDFEFDRLIFEDESVGTFFEQLLCYFIFRHFNMEKGNYYEAICFSLSACCIIGALCSLHKAKHHKLEFSDIVRYARMYSEEVEYSKENTDMLIKYFE